MIKLYDTAGLRRRVAGARGGGKAVGRPTRLRAIRFAEVVVVLLEADRALEKQDLHIAALAAEEGRAMVIGDQQMGPRARTRQAKRRAVRAQGSTGLLPQVKGVPRQPRSAR